MKLKIFTISVMFLLIVGGCASKFDVNDKTIKHAEKSVELSVIMHELDQLVFDNAKSELELDNIRRRYALTLSDTIKEQTYKIESMPTDKLSQKVSKDNMESFKKYIIQLRRDAQDINEIAQRYELEKLDDKLQDLKRTCDSCHSVCRTF